jgi:S-formylglutathione hydrolase FrmB
MSKLQTRLLLAVLFLVPLLLFPSSAAAGRVQCGVVKSTMLKRAVRYCVLLPPSYDTEKTRRYPALYYLHGLFENEQSLVNFGGWNMVEDLQGKGSIGEFLIITPDGGRGFYINSHDGRERYEDFFIRELIPAMDRTFRTRAARAARSIGGSSMGGYGALRFAFKYPQLFAAVGVHQAALVENPSRGLTASVAPFLGRVTGAFGSPPDRAFWDAQSPFTLARRPTNASRLKVYFDCGTEDEYGFHRGAKALHELLESRKVPHEFHLFPGGHGWLYVAEHLQDSLEFHSRALGLTR